MTSASEFVGFIVISVFPSNDEKDNRTRRAFYQHKSNDALLANVEDGQEVNSSEDETTNLTINHRQHDAPEQPLPSSVSRSKSPERPKGPALTKPDFWMIALIMSMCMAPSVPYLLM